MGAGKEADFAADRTDFVDAAAVGTNLVDGDHVTDDFLDHLLGNVGDVVGIIGVDVGKVFVDVGFDGVHLFFAFDLISREDSRLHGFFAISMNGFDDVSRRFFFDEFLFRYRNAVQERKLEFDDFLISSWATMMASRICSSGTSLAPPSTMRIASFVPATTMSMSLCSL